MRVVKCLSLVVAGAFALGPALAQAEDVRTVTVSGSGTVSVPPDQVDLAISVMTEENDLLEARAESDKEIREILELGMSFGVREEDFRVTKLNISYGYNEERRRFFYRVDRAATMTLKDIDKFDALLAAALKRGGFNITRIAFGISNVEELAAEARRRAVADARARAAHLAELNGLNVGLAREISEGGLSYTPFVTSVIPVVGQRRNLPNIDIDPFGGGDEALRYGKESGESDSKTYFVSVAQAGGEENTNAGERGRTAAGLGVIATSAQVNIDFEMTK